MADEDEDVKGAASSAGQGTSYQVLRMPPTDIIDVVVEISEREVQIEEVALTVIREASLHFHSQGYSSLQTADLHTALMAELNRIISRHDTEQRPRSGVRWRARIGVVADSLTLITGGQALVSFAVGALAERTVISQRSDTGDAAPISMPWPITGMRWLWVRYRSDHFRSYLERFISAIFCLEVDVSDFPKAFDLRSSFTLELRVYPRVGNPEGPMRLPADHISSLALSEEQYGTITFPINNEVRRYLKWSVPAKLIVSPTRKGQPAPRQPWRIIPIRLPFGEQGNPYRPGLSSNPNWPRSRV